MICVVPSDPEFGANVEEIIRGFQFSALLKMGWLNLISLLKLKHLVKSIF